MWKERLYLMSPTHYPCDIARTSEWYANIFTMKMESLLEPTSNKLLVGGMWDLLYRSTMWQLNRNNGAIQSLESILVQVMDWRIPLKNRSLCSKTLFFSTSTVYSFFKPKGIFMIDNWFSIKPSLYCKNNFYWAIHDCFSNLFSSISGLKFAGSLTPCCLLWDVPVWEQLEQLRNPVKEILRNPTWSQAVFMLINGEPWAVYLNSTKVIKDTFVRFIANCCMQVHPTFAADQNEAVNP